MRLRTTSELRPLGRRMAVGGGGFGHRLSFGRGVAELPGRARCRPGVLQTAKSDPMSRAPILIPFSSTGLNALLLRYSISGHLGLELEAQFGSHCWLQSDLLQSDLSRLLQSDICNSGFRDYACFRVRVFISTYRPLVRTWPAFAPSTQYRYLIAPRNPPGLEALAKRGVDALGTEGEEGGEGGRGIFTFIHALVGIAAGIRRGFVVNIRY